jgi:hypothetical protein
MMPTWGTPSDVKELDKLFDMMKDFTTRRDAPAFIGEFGVVNKKESVSRARWMTAVAKASISRNMVPVYWDTGNDISRHEPYAPTDEMSEMLRNIGRFLIEEGAAKEARKPGSHGVAVGRQ